MRVRRNSFLRKRTTLESPRRPTAAPSGSPEHPVRGLGRQARRARSGRRVALSSKDFHRQHPISQPKLREVRSRGAAQSASLAPPKFAEAALVRARDMACLNASCFRGDRSETPTSEDRVQRRRDVGNVIRPVKSLSSRMNDGSRTTFLSICLDKIRNMTYALLLTEFTARR